MMNTYQNLMQITDELKALGKTPKLVQLKSTATRKRKSALGVKAHSSNGRRFNNNNTPLHKVG